MVGQNYREVYDAGCSRLLFEPWLEMDYECLVGLRTDRTNIYGEPLKFNRGKELTFDVAAGASYSFVDGTDGNLLSRGYSMDPDSLFKSYSTIFLHAGETVKEALINSKGWNWPLK